MTILRQWLNQQRYASVRYGELAVPLPQGGHLRGIRITKFIWLGRDLRFYRVGLNGRPVLIDDAVANSIPAGTVEAQWQRAVVRHERRKALAKARRRSLVASRALTSP